MDQQNNPSTNPQNTSLPNDPLVPPSASRRKVIQPISSGLTSAQVNVGPPQAQATDRVPSSAATPGDRPVSPVRHEDAPATTIQMATTPANQAAPSVSPETTPAAPHRPDVSQIYPDFFQNAPSSGNTYRTSSSFSDADAPSEPTKTPWGVYVIGGYTLLGFIASFAGGVPAQGSPALNALYALAVFMQLLLAVGLLLRFEVARKGMIAVSGLFLLLSVVALFMLHQIQQGMQWHMNNYRAEISEIDQTKLTDKDKEQLASMDAEMAMMEEQAKAAVIQTIIRFGITAVGATVVILYLTRPRIKKVFRPLS